MCRGGPLRVLIAGGGTGGHLFPGIAVAEELRRRVGAEVRFVGSEHGIERTAVPQAGFEVDLLPIRGVMGQGLRGLLRAAWRVPRSLFAAWVLQARFRPSLVVGVGGYAAFPALAVAVLARHPIVLLEQNAAPGLVTRLFARFARVVCVSFPEAQAAVGPHARLTGNPIRWRPGVGESVGRKDAGVFRVLVFGGSAGAHRLNAVAPGAVARLGRDVHVVHQTGRADQAAVESRYAELDVDAQVLPFIEDMQAAYEACDVAVCRSGATTLAELTALGVAAILVPFPFAAGDHQRINGQTLVEADAAWMILDHDLDEPTLAARLAEARGNPDAVRAVRAQARRLGRPEALAEVVQACLEASGDPGAASAGGMG